MGEKQTTTAEPHDPLSPITRARRILVHKFARVIGETHCRRRRLQLIYRLDEPEGSLQDYECSRPTLEVPWQGLGRCADDLAGLPHGSRRSPLGCASSFVTRLR